MPGDSVFSLRLRGGGAPKSPAKSSRAGEKRAGGGRDSDKKKVARTGKAKSAGADSESGESGDQVRLDSGHC